MRVGEVGAVAEAGGGRCIAAHLLALDAVGPDLPPHRDDDALDLLRLDRVRRPVGGPDVGGERGELGSILLGEEQKRFARRPCLRAFIEERALPSGVLGPRFLGAAGAGSGMAGAPAGRGGKPVSL